MAQLGVASRRESERLIVAGRVAVDGEIVTELGTKVSPRAQIAVDGAVVKAPSKTTVVKLYKPPRVVTARKDPEGRPTVYDLLGPDLPFLAHVGRLDAMSEGLLLFTNDGDLADKLMHPRSGVPRTYAVKVRGNLSRETVAKLEAGVPLDGEPTRGLVIERLPSRSKHDWLELTLFEGKNRHVRRVLEAVGHPVTRLVRTAYGSVTLDDIEPNRWRRLTPGEVHELQQLVR